MTQLWPMDPLFPLSGFFVGLLVGQTGMGGGALMTPILVLLFGVHPATAVGTDLLYASATKSVGTLVHGLSHTVNWRIVGRLAAGSVPATAVTLLLTARLLLIAGMGHWWLGSVDWPLLASLLTGSIPGIIVGSYLAVLVPDTILRPILAATLVVVGARLVF